MIKGIGSLPFLKGAFLKGAFLKVAFLKVAFLKGADVITLKQ